MNVVAVAAHATGVDFGTVSSIQPPSGPVVGDTAVGDFRSGTADSGIHVCQVSDGELVLTPALTSEFDGALVPANWFATPWNPGASTVVGSGVMTVDGSRSGPFPVQPAGQSLEFMATFSTDLFEHAGFAVTLESDLYAIFSVKANAHGDAKLYARMSDGIVEKKTELDGYLGTPHRYRIDWGVSSATYYIDGVEVASHSMTIADSMRPLFSDFNVGQGSLTVDWMRLAPYASSGTFTSRVLDAGTEVVWSTAEWTAQLPPGTGLSLGARFGNTAVPDATWTPFSEIDTSGDSIGGISRYVQYQVLLTGDGSSTPTLQDVTFRASAEPPPPAVSLSIDDVTVTEGNSGTTNLQFNVLLSGPSTRTVAVNYATADGTASAGSDYSPVSGQLLFAPGETVQPIVVPVLTDTTFELTETFSMNLSGSINATIRIARGTAIILDEDPGAPTVMGQPVNRLVSMGFDTSFTFFAPGNPAPTYQWQISTNRGSSWSDLSNAAPFSGATTATLAIAGGSLRLTGTYYRCVSTNPLGSATSKVVSLMVMTPATSIGDFNADKKADLTVFRPSTGTWYSWFTGTSSGLTVQWGVPFDIPVPADYDGDGKADVAVFRPSNGMWYWVNSSNGVSNGVQWGNGGDVPVPGDYNGDGRTDIAVFRPSTGTWYWVLSGSGAMGSVLWGNGDDLPLPGDYDGDGKTDIAVYRPGNGTWYVRNSQSGSISTVQWGVGGDMPVAADYDGNGAVDIAVYRPSNGNWYVRSSGGGMTAIQWGVGGDVPVPADFDGDGKADIAVYRPGNGTWYPRFSNGGTASLQWGVGGDVPIQRR